MIGTMSGIVCYLAVEFKNRMKWDDALDVWGVHGVGGILGVILLGVFASTTVNAAGSNGLLYGNVVFFFKEMLAVIAAGTYAFGFTYGMLWLINKITPVRISESDEEGLDEALHGEQAYEM